MAPPRINTYHCTFCTNLLLATTHTISNLPVRKGNGEGDDSLILPVCGVVPGVSDSRLGDAMDVSGNEDGDLVDREGGGGGNGDGDGRRQEGGKDDEEEPLPSYGYTTLLSLSQPNKQVIIRREDGFEKRGLYRCARCGVVVGYEVLGEGSGSGSGKERGREGGEFDGKILYLLKGGLMSTEVMRSGKKVREQDAEVLGGGVGVWE